MNNIKHVVHLHSSNVLSDGSAKLPLPNQLEYGELAVNYGDGVETISFKNDNNDIVTVITSEQIDKKINDLKNEIPNEVYIGETIDGTPDLFIDTSVDNDGIDIYTKSQIDLIVTELNNKIDTTIGPESAVNSVNGMKGDVVLEIPNVDNLVTQEQLESNINDLNERINELDTPTLPENIVTSVNGQTGDVILNIPNVDGFIKEEKLEEEINKVIEQIPDVSDFATKSEVPVLPENIVNTINGQTGDITLEIPSINGLVTEEKLQEEIDKVNGQIPDVSNFVEKEELISTELTISESLNELNSRLPENIVNSVNGQSGDVTITIPDVSNFATKTELANKQDKIIAGKNITITNSKTIDVVGYTYSVNKSFYGSDCSTSHSQCFLYGDGLGTVDNNETVFGKYNKYDHFSGWGDGKPLLEVGDGTSSARKTVFMIQKSYGAAFASGGFKQESMGDLAEYFEWEDGNPNNEDRIGYMVTSNGDKILLANSIDECIGIVTGTGAFVADAAALDWHGRFMKDEWGRNIYDEIDGVKIQKENPDYDPNQEYIPRMHRKEWSPIGLVGKVFVRQDGTLKINGHASCKNGIATNGNEGYRVLKIVNDEIALVLVK